MSQHQLIFAVLYQLPAVAIGLFVARLIPSPPLRALFVLPGTFIHELLHFLVGFFLNAKPVSFSIWPRRAGQSTWVMGSVGFVNLRWYNGIPVALAPLLAPIAAIWFAPHATHWQPQLIDIQYWMLAAPVLSMSLPSRTDIEICFVSVLPIFCLLCLSYFIYFKT